MASNRFRPTHHHIKSGGDYEVIGTATMQCARTVPDETLMIVYQDKNGRMFVRAQYEFNDGRFTKV